MPLFRIVDQKLSSIRLQEIGLERDVQRLVEANLEEVFGLQFVTTEFQLNSLRIDTLGFDPESKSFVIVEYKRDRSSSVIDQGYAYLALALNNKADFILEYNQRNQTPLSKDDVDWSATRVIFVAAQYTPHQLGAINFHDLPIELWEARFYEGEVLSLEQKTPETHAESIKTVSKKSTAAESQAVEREIKSYTVDTVFKQGSTSRVIFDELVEAIQALDANLTVSPTKIYVRIKLVSDWRNILTLNPMRDGIRIDFLRTHPSDLVDPESRITYQEKSQTYFGQHISSLLITSREDIDYAMTLIRQAYERHLKGFGK